MKLFDFSSPAPRASMSGAFALVVSSSAFAHAYLIPGTLATDGHRTQGDCAFNVK